MFDLLNMLYGIPITLLALTVHEFAHGWVSTKLGDPTPRLQGRLTLNPFAHLDLMGTILMIITGFGWAKPVQINPSYYKNKKSGMALCAAAGPLANFVLAFLGVFVGYLLMTMLGRFGVRANFLHTLIYVFTWRNLTFMVFNLIPLPPLDGFKVAGMFIPNRIYYNILRYEQYVIILIMVLSFTGVFNRTIGSVGYFLFYLIERVVMAMFGAFI